MSDGLVAQIEGEGLGVRLLVLVTNQRFAGMQAQFELEQQFEVRDGRSVDRARPLAKRGFALAMGRQEIELPDLPRDAWSYRGERLDIRLVGRLSVPASDFLGTEVRLVLDRPAGLAPRAATPGSQELREPEDEMKLFASLRAIAPGSRTLAIAAMLVFGSLLFASALVGVHDQFVPESQTWFYSGDRSSFNHSPIAVGLFGSLVIFGLAWDLVRRQLQEFATFDAAMPAGLLRRGGTCKASEIMWGVPTFDLENATVRLLAMNVEHGEVKTDKVSSNTPDPQHPTVVFSHDSRTIVLYEALLPRVPAGRPIENFLTGEIRFDPIFDSLFPPLMINGTHGLALRLEAQLLHSRFPDLRVTLPAEDLAIRDFYEKPG